MKTETLMILKGTTLFMVSLFLTKLIHPVHSGHLLSSFVGAHHHHHQFTKRDQLHSKPHQLHSLQKRGDSFHGRATFYSTGLGACGKTNVDSEFIVALNQGQYTANHWCFKMITISYGGKTADAQIVDECPGCPEGGLDMSPSLFEHFASQSVGVFYMSWSLKEGGGGGGGDGGDDQPKPAPVTTAVHPVQTPAPAPVPPVVVAKPPVIPPIDSSNPKPDHIDIPNPVKPINPPVVPPPVKHPQPDLSLTNPTNPKPQNGLSQPNNITRSNSNPIKNSINPPVVVAVQKLPTVTPQPVDAYAIGGNLDGINQLVIAFGSLTVVSAQAAIQVN